MFSLTTFRRLVPVTAAAVLPFCFASCAGMSDERYAASEAIDRAERKGAVAPGTQQKFQRDQDNTVAQGTVGGAVLGGILGGVIGHQRGNTGAGAAIGAVGGGLLGNTYGRSVADRKAAAVVVDVNLDVYIQEAREANRSAKATVRNLRGQLAGLRKQVTQAKARGDRAALVSARTQLRTMQNQANVEERNLDRAIGSGTRQLNKAGRGHPQFQGLSSGVSSATETRGEVESTKREIASLLNQI